MILKLAFFLAAAVACFAQAGPVAGVGNFIHAVGDLDRSVRFYRDVLGMDMPRPAGGWQTGEEVLKMYDASGGKFRVANAQIPGSPMRVELAEFQGVDRKPVQRQWGVTGSSVLMLTVADLAPVQERIKAAQIPVLAKLKKACNGQGIVVGDPDGFAVMLVEHSPASGPAPAKSNFTGMRFGYLESGDAIEKGPFAALGLSAQSGIPSCMPVEAALLNASPAIVTLPGGFEIWLAKGKPAKGQHLSFQPHDPGAAVLRLMVTNVDAAVQALGQAQVKIVSAGGAIQTLPPAGLRATILQAPDDLFIQVVK